MAWNSEPSTPLEAYKAIIDQLVDEATRSVSARLVCEHGMFSKAVGSDAANAFVNSLTPEQRDVLANILSEERQSAIHDVLATLTWWLTTRSVGLTFRGEPMPIELSGMGLHGDYVGRLDDWEWPRD